MQRVFLFVSVLCVAGLGGCDRRSEATRASAPRPPPAAAIAPVGSATPLVDKLARLEDELAAAAAGRLEDEAAGHLLRAEAITDRLLEKEPPFPWLGEAYLLEARLRQLQARADGIVARLRRGARRQSLVAEVLDMREGVAELRRIIESGAGGAAPMSFDSLLDVSEPVPTGGVAEPGEG